MLRITPSSHVMDDGHTYSSRIFILGHMLLGMLRFILILAVLH